jgi:LysM repeat protein
MVAWAKALLSANKALLLISPAICAHDRAKDITQRTINMAQMQTIRFGIRQFCGAGALSLVLLALAPAAQAADPLCGDAIRVAPGDTMLDIARTCRTTVPALVAANPNIINPNRLHVGQIVLMPGRSVTTRPVLPPVAGTRPVQTGACGASVRVQPGDTFSNIARRCGVSMAQLRAANPQLRDPNVIFTGMLLHVPTGSTVLRPPVTSLPPAASPNLRISGTITGEGATCQAFRGDDGVLYTFAGAATRPLRIGDRIEVTGTRAASSICQQGVTITATQIVLLNAQHNDTIDLTGTITREGVTCTAMRGDDGRLYTLAGQTGNFGPGDRVRVTGDLAQMSFCQQGSTVNVRTIRSAW